MPEAAPRALRADAERNRRLVLEAAASVFAERGLEAGVAEVARRAGPAQSLEEILAAKGRSARGG